MRNFSNCSMEYMRLGMSWISLRTLVYSGHSMDEWDGGIGKVRTYVPSLMIPSPSPSLPSSCPVVQ